MGLESIKYSKITQATNSIPNRFLACLFHTFSENFLLDSKAYPPKTIHYQGFIYY